MPDVSKSMVACTIPFNQEGVSFGHLRVPHSVHRSAYGHIPIPIAVAMRGDGPTLLLTGGVHGDEYEGPLALYGLMQALRDLEITGRVIIVPSVNHLAYMTGLRVSPVDQLNLNRSFPGDRNGTVTEVIAHYITSELLPLADYAVDLHAGGSSLQYLPTLLAPEWKDLTKRAETERLIMAFNPDRVAFFDSLKALGGDDRVFGNVADKHGCSFLAGEFGGGATVNLDGRTMVERGLFGIMQDLGILKREAPIRQSKSSIRRLTLDSPDLFAFAPCAGIFEPSFKLGDEIVAGQLAGRIFNPDAPWEAPRSVEFLSGGLAICIRTFALVQPGDCLGHLARDLDA